MQTDLSTNRAPSACAPGSTPPAPAEPDATPASRGVAAGKLAKLAAAVEPEPSVPPPPPVPAALAHLSLPLQGADFHFRGIHAEAKVPAGQVVEAARQLDQEGFALDTITGVDWIAESQMEVVYDYFHPHLPLRVAIRARLPRERPEIPSIAEVFPGANWHEREAHDFFGIIFAGHPDLSPFLLPEDATYHPLRKDFTPCS